MVQWFCIHKKWNSKMNCVRCDLSEHFNRYSDQMFTFSIRVLYIIFPSNQITCALYVFRKCDARDRCICTYRTCIIITDYASNRSWICGRAYTSKTSHELQFCILPQLYAVVQLCVLKMWDGLVNISFFYYTYTYNHYLSSLSSFDL